MKILELELKNWGPHKHFKAVTNSNIIGIIGNNGAGKSNILQAIDYALTGNLNKQKQEKYIYNFGSESGATTATVRLVFKKNNKIYSITRTITASGSKRVLVIDGKQLTKSSDVEAALINILGADKNALAQAVFIKQGTMSRFVKGSPAERQALFQSIMNLKFIEPRVDDLSSKILALKVGLCDVEGDIKEKENKLEELNKKLDDSKNLLVNESALSDAVKLLKNAVTDINTINLNNKELNDLNYKIDTLNTSIKVETYEKSKLPDKESIKTEIERLQQLITKAEAAQQQYKRSIELTKTIESLEQELKVISSASVEKKITELEEKSKELKTSKELLASLKKSYEDYTKVFDDYKHIKTLYNNCLSSYTKNNKLLSEQINRNTERIHSLSIDKLNIIAKINAIESLQQQNSENNICPVCNNTILLSSLIPADKDVQTVLKDLKDSVTAIDRELNKLNKNNKENNNSILNHLNQLAQYKATLDSLDSRLKAFDDSCKSYNSQSDLVLQSAIESLNKLTIKLNDLKHKLPELINKEILLKAKKEELRTLDQVVCSDIDLTTIKNVLNSKKNELEQINCINSKLEKLNTTLTTYINFKDKYKQNIDTALNNLHELLDILKENEIATDFIKDELNFNEILHISNEINNISKNQEQIKTTITILSELYKDIENEINKLKDLDKKVKERQLLINDLNIVKSIISRTGVPLAFMNDIFEKLLVLVQDLLTNMNANFNVSLDPENPCSFLFTRTDTQDAVQFKQEQLSGGQAMRLSLAMLLACQKLILPDVGLLVLDEPSSHIDNDGVEQMRDMFISMQHMLNNTDMQLIIVDHNEKLIASFTETIKLN